MPVPQFPIGPTPTSQTAATPSSCSSATPSASDHHRTHAPDAHRTPCTKPQSAPCQYSSEISRTFSFAIGAQKLGQPVPDSNFVSELNSALSQQMQRNTPFSCSFKSFPLKANSVSACRVISNTPGGSSLRHSSSVLTTRATLTFASRFPSSENCTIVTSIGSVLVAASITRGLRSDNNASPPTAAPTPDKNNRRPKLTSLHRHPIQTCLPPQNTSAPRPKT